MSIKRNVIRRGAAWFAVGALLVGIAIPVLQKSPVGATGQVTARTIKMSDSTASAANVQYELTFTPTAVAGDLIVDFCSDTPLEGATCAFTAATVPTVGAGITSSTGTASVVGTGTPKHTLKVVGLSLTGGTPVTITFTAGISNPTTANVNFYARILTYATGTGGNYTPANTTGTAPIETTAALDFGGIALTTATQVNITARVMESLTFCVSALDLSNNKNCTNATAPTIIIGHGSPAIIDSSATDVANVYTQASTNAQTGLIIRMKAVNTCASAGLSNAGAGAATCNIIGMSGTSAAALAAGTAKFGLYVSPSSLTTSVPSSTGTITPDSNYYNASHVTNPTDLWFGMDESAVSGVKSTYGDAIASSAGPVAQVNNTLAFGASASLATQAGIYTGNEILIATGTF